MGLVNKAFRFENELNKSTLFQNLLRIGIIACVLTLIAEAFLPLGNTYYFTVFALVCCIVALVIHLSGNHDLAYHFILLLLPVGFYCIIELTNKTYPSITHLYTLGIVFAVAFIPRKKHIGCYLALFILLHLLQTFRYLNINKTYENWFEYLYDSIHIIAYTFAIFIITLYFIRFIGKQKLDLEILRLENENTLLKERTRISQILHDGINSRIASLKLHVSNNAGKNKIKILQELSSINEDVRSISHALNPHTLSFHGLKGAIEEEIIKIESNNQSIQIRFEYDSKLDLGQKMIREILYYAVLELIQNNIKHSNATEVKISIYMTQDEIILDFIDNGEAIKVDKEKFGLGLRHISSNAKLYNGSFTMKRKADQNLQRLAIPKTYISDEDK